VTHGRVKKQQQNRQCLKINLNDMTDGELQMFRGMAFQIFGAA